MTNQEKQKLKDVLIERKNIAAFEYNDEDVFVGIYFCDLVDIIDSIMQNTGWHPASELPPIDENGNSPELIAITSDGMLMRVYFHQENKEYSFWVESDDWNKQVKYGVNVKWWSYPPRED